jgi:2-succinyl-5-enolpyruvyl-6-hydroxy-3-cyclohexene-1-carboxylate synthase
MKINRNIFFAGHFVNALVQNGVRDVIISPGSRSTALVYAFATNSKINAVSILDERSAAFFATGLARSSGRPVAVLCTSGTAAVEYYPAIVEAYHQRIPLIVCTADRPVRLRGTGANQTIDQFDLYHNHICSFAEFQVEKPQPYFYKELYTCINETMATAKYIDRGPVHFNIGMDKPFEPDAFTDDIQAGKFETAIQKVKTRQFSISGAVSAKTHKMLHSLFMNAKTPVIIAGPGKYPKQFRAGLKKLFATNTVPVFLDVASGLRFGKPGFQKGLTHYENYLTSFAEAANFSSDLVILFGRYPTAKSLDILLKKRSGPIVIANPFGDRFDPHEGSRYILDSEPDSLMDFILSDRGSLKHESVSLHALQNTEEKARKNAALVCSENAFSELTVIKAFIEQIPSGSQLFISNSLTIRDCDRIIAAAPQEITVYENRGASGIDGILSSALGVAAAGKKDTYLLVGDLAFIYDIPALQTGVLQNIPLKIVLLNNQGGKIFDYLPSAGLGNIHKEFFLTPQRIDFRKTVTGFGADYTVCTSLKSFESGLRKLITANKITVLEARIKNTDSSRQREQLKVFSHTS